MTDAEMEHEDDLFLTHIIQSLMSRFDAVQVFVTRDEPDGRTLGASVGKGNWYSRVGVVREWVEGGKIEHESPNSGDEL